MLVGRVTDPRTANRGLFAWVHLARLVNRYARSMNLVQRAATFRLAAKLMRFHLPEPECVLHRRLLAALVAAVMALACAAPQSKSAVGVTPSSSDRVFEAAGVGRLHDQTTLTARGEVAASRGQYREAEELFRRAIEEDEGFRAHVMLGRLLRAQGRRKEAREQFQVVIDAYNDERILHEDAEAMSYVAISAWAFGAFQDAYHAFSTSFGVDPSRVETAIEWSRMLIEKHDHKRAERLLATLAKKRPDDASILTALGWVHFQQGTQLSLASRNARRAITLSPQHGAAHVLLAELSLVDMETDGALLHVERALRINPKDLEALAIKASILFLADRMDELSAVERQVRSLHPTFARFYGQLAMHAVVEHRYVEGVGFAEQSVRVDPDYAEGYAVLGLNLLRIGREDEGYSALKEAWRRDKYDARVLNTLNLYERVFRTQYTTLEHRRMVLRLHRKEQAVLRRYLLRHLDHAITDLSERYDVEPPSPLHIDLLASKDDFSVRTTGLPNLGLQGVCFGNVVTVVSPLAGSYNWGQITWHELAHVFHLKLSNGRVPRWFTEGLAEFEAQRARPEWKREKDHALALAFRKGRLPRLSEFNRAFTHAKSRDELYLVYYASSVAAEYFVTTYGMEKVRQMLESWGRGSNTEQVIQSVLGIDTQAFDSGFARYLQRRFERAPDHRRYDRHVKVASAAHSRGDGALRRRELLRAVEVDPNRSEAWAGLLDVSMTTKDETLRLRALRNLSMLRQHSRLTWLAFVRELHGRGMWKELVDVGASAIFVSPYDHEIHSKYGDALRRTGRLKQARFEYETARMLGKR